MHKRSIPGLQVTLFTPQSLLQRSYGHADAVKKRQVTKTTLFQSGALIRPLSAYTALKYFPKKVREGPLPRRVGPYSLQNSFVSPVHLGHILTMTSGLPVYREGVVLVQKNNVPKQNFKITRENLLIQSLKIQSLPGTQIQAAPQGYAYIRELVQNKQKENFIELVQKQIKTIPLSQSCVLLKACPQLELQPQRLSEALTGIRQRHFPVPKVDFLFPEADSLFTTSHDYATFIVWLYRQSEKAKLSQRKITDNNSPASYFFSDRFSFSYDKKNLGGSSYGFYYSRPIWYEKKEIKKEVGSYLYKKKESTVYYIESSLPGYSALAFIHEKGYGAVFLVNANDLFFLRVLQRYVYHFMGIMNLKEGFNQNTAGKQPEPVDFEASYRPIGSLPKQYSTLHFLNELQLRQTENGIELSSFFEKEVFVNLFPLKKDLYIARGVVEMDGWRLLFRRDFEKDGEIVGFDMDLLRYERVPVLLSAPSILIYMSVLFALPLFILFFYFLFYKKPRSASPSL